jgi:hypothetical protein
MELGTAISPGKKRANLKIRKKTLELESMKQAKGMPSRLQRRKHWTLWRGRPPPKRKKKQHQGKKSLIWGAPATLGVIPTTEKVRVSERKSKTLDDCDTPGSTGNLAANRSGRAGLKGGADIAVGEDHRGGTVSQESDVTDTALGRKGTAMHR